MYSRAMTLMMASLMPAAVLAFQQMEATDVDVQDMAIIDEIGRAP